MKIEVRQKLELCFDFSKRAVKAFFKFIVIPVLALYFLLYAILNYTHVIPNNLHARALLKRLERIPPPDESKMLDTYIELGAFYHPGTHPKCEMLSGIIYGTDNIAGVYQHFFSKQIQGYRKNEKLSVNAVILRVEYKGVKKEEMPGEEMPGIDKYDNRSILPSMEERCGHARDCYIVYVKDKGCLELDYRFPY